MRSKQSFSSKEAKLFNSETTNTSGWLSFWQLVLCGEYWVHTEYGNGWLFNFYRNTTVIAAIALNKNTCQCYSTVNPNYKKKNVVLESRIFFLNYYFIVLFTCTTCPKFMALCFFYIEVETCNCRCPVGPIVLEKLSLDSFLTLGRRITSN